jgi:tetratricopeptide (TPR) repeat protein
MIRGPLAREWKGALVTRDDRVTEVLAACRERADRGEDVDPDDVVRAHPDIADELRRRFAAQTRLAGMFGRGAPPAAPSLTGRALGPYRLGAVLGAGGMGTVYRATVESRAPGLAAGDVVAVKVVHPHLLHREGFFKRFLREAETGRRVRHANVVRTIDADAVPGDGGHVHFLVMEFVEGQTLRALLDEVGRIPEELCRHVGREAAKALAAIHAEGVVHRDLKPDNLLITGDDVIKLMDLGVAQLGDDALRVSQTGAFVGSVRYAAPEQFAGRRAKIDGRADLYALGLTLYELATGRHPFDGDDFHEVLRRQLHETPRPAGELNPQLSPFFEELLKSLLAKDPAQRPASADDVRVALEDGDRSTWWRTRAIEVRAATRRPLRRVRVPRETALYGRDAETARLRALFEKAKAGDGNVVLVEGEAGIGKSRLVDEFVGQLVREGEDLDFLFGSYPPGGAATASGAFSTAYREHFGDAGLEDALREALPQTPLLVPAFAALLKGDAAPSGVEPLTKDSLQTVFVHATRSIAARRPTIVLIDDLHFAPEEGRALFMSLALAVPGHRVLLVGTARPGLPEKWVQSVEHLGHVVRVPLPRLGPKDLVRLLVDSLRSERLAEDLAGRIALKSDGNPFFVFEILRGLREGQFLTQQPDGTWVTTQILHDIQIPSSIRDLVSARVADLDAEDKDLLDVASVLGFEFDAAIVADALGAGRVPVLKRLARIEAKHRLVRSAGETFVFDHHQVQETLYAALPPPLAREYHAAVAEAIEVRTGADAKDPTKIDGGVCFELSEHFLKGGQGARALRYLDAALTHLDAHYLNDAAVGLAERALGAPGVLAGAARGRVLLRMASRLHFLGRREPQRAAVEEALALARESGDRQGEADATGSLGEFSCTLGRFAEACEHHERRRVIAREIGDRQGEIDATGSLGVVLCWLGRLSEAWEHLERCLVRIRESGDRRRESRATGNSGLVLWSLGRFAEARERFQRGLELARDVGDRQGETILIGNLGNVHWALGRFAEAREHHERALTLTREVGDRHGQALATGNLGSVLWSLGRFAEAREQFERHLALAREIGDRRGEGVAFYNLAQLAGESGDVALAERLIADALELLRAIGARAEEAASLYALGALFARTGRTDAARADLEAALALARQLSLPGIELAALSRLATLPGGDADAAVAALAVHGRRADAKVLAESLLLLWQTTRDRAHLVEAKRLLDGFVAHAPPEDRESMLTNVRLHREIVAAARGHLPG